MATNPPRKTSGKAYHPPRLIHYGKVAQVTAGFATHGNDSNKLKTRS